MDYQISEEIKKLTKKCHCNFHCLDGGDTCSVFIKLKDKRWPGLFGQPEAILK
jgi:hypothetical protein